MQSREVAWYHRTMSDKTRCWVWIALFGVTSYMITYFIDVKYPFNTVDSFAVLALCCVWLIAIRESRRMWRGS